MYHKTALHIVKCTVETAAVQSECGHFLPHCPQINTQLFLEIVPSFWWESTWNGQEMYCV